MTDDTIRHDITRLWTRVEAIERDHTRDTSGAGMVHLADSMKQYADTGDMRVKGEVIAQINAVQRTLDKIVETLEAGGATVPSASARSWRNDWRLLVGGGAALGYAISRAPETGGMIAKIVMGAG